MNEPTRFYSNYGVVTASAVKATPGVVTKIRGLNFTGTAYYLQLHDKASAPTTGDVPLVTFPVGIGASTSATTEERPSPGDMGAYRCASGIWVGWSSTYGTYTAVTPATQAIEVEYV